MYLLQLVPFVILSWVALNQRNFGALTTVYPGDPEIENPSGAGIVLATVYETVDNPATACFRSNFGLVQGWNSGFLSLGRCPFGYTAAESPTSKDETRALCCHTGFAKGEYITPCEKVVDGESTTQALLTRTETVLEFFLVSSTSTLASTQRTLHAMGIPIRWHPIDLSASVLPASSSPATTSSPVSFTTTATEGHHQPLPVPDHRRKVTS